MSRLRGVESGFSLVELLVAVVIASLVALAIGSAFEVDLVSTRDDQAAVSAAQDAAATGALLTRDVQSATSLSTSSKGCAGTTGTLVLALGWTAPSAQKVDYAYSDGTLTRVRCGAAADSLVVASQLSGPPAVSCTSGACSAGSSGVTVALSESDGTSYPLTAYRRVALP